MHVLIVDDSETNRNLLRLLLTHEHLTCSTAADGIDALERSEKESFDLLISDLDMPRMNGVELAARLRQRCPGLPLLAFSGSSGDGLWEKAEKVFDQMFEKPNPIAVVQEAVRLARECAAARMCA